MVFGLPQLVGQIGEQHPLQVIDLMLEDARQPVFGFDGYWLAAAVLPFDRDSGMAFDLGSTMGRPCSASSRGAL